MFGCLGSRSGSDLTSVAAVSAILEIWDSTSTGVNWRGEVGGPGGSPLCKKFMMVLMVIFFSGNEVMMRVDELYSGWHCVSDCKGWGRKKGLSGKKIHLVYFHVLMMTQYLQYRL